MGCDIHICVEMKEGDRFVSVDGLQFAEGTAPFDWRSYGMFGFLADVRNYSAVPPLAPTRGVPLDASAETRDYLLDCHSCSWLLTAELATFDYDQEFEDRRVTRQMSEGFWNGGVTAEAGGGSVTTFRDFLGPAFFADLEVLKASSADRIVFGFDS